MSYPNTALNTPYTSGTSDKIIFRTNKIIGTLPRIVRRGEIGPKSARLSCGVYPALRVVHTKNITITITTAISDHTNK